MCSQGHYCPEGSATETPCPSGTYGPLNGASKLEDCLVCDLGHYCDDSGLSSPGEKKCAPGYYCPVNQYQEEPSSYICPRGYKCPKGSIAPIPCSPGEYQVDKQMPSCNQCDAGYYCDGTDGTAKVECPRGYYCPLGTGLPMEHPCPVGTYRDSLKAESLNDCEDCPSGYYCPERGMSIYSDLCT